MKAVRFPVLGLLLMITILTIASVASAAGYSANLVSTDKKGTHMSKIWVSYSLWSQRMEMPEHPSMVIIVRMDKKLIWNIDTQQKMYMEMSLRPGMSSSTIASGEKAPTEVERTFLLTETVEGHVADKYRMTHLIDNNRVTHYIWLLKSNNLFPIKTQHDDTITVFKNLVFDEPPASMFEVPSGFQKMSMPMMR